MADHQKIHPVDVEAPPTAPLVASDSTKSEKGEPIEQYPPPARPTVPLPRSRKRRSFCCKFICWTIGLVTLLVIIIAAIAGILYLVFQPKLPKYSIDRLRITDFRLDTNASLFAQFNVTITTRNPNKNVGIYYENGSLLSVYYTDISLCQGSLPKFYQGHRNTTVLDVTLTGQTQNATSLLTALTQQQMETGSVPLKLRADVPVRVKLGKLKLKKVKFLVRCNLMVDNLMASNNNMISIRTSSCKFKLRI